MLSFPIAYNHKWGVQYKIKITNTLFLNVFDILHNKHVEFDHMSYHKNTNFTLISGDAPGDIITYNELIELLNKMDCIVSCVLPIAGIVPYVIGDCTLDCNCV